MCILCGVDYYYSAISCAPTLSPFRDPPTLYFSRLSFLHRPNSLSCPFSQPPHQLSQSNPHPHIHSSNPPTLPHPLTLLHTLPLPLYPPRGKRRLQLEHIKEELRYPWLDLRKSIGPPSESDMFTTITGTCMRVCVRVCVCVRVGVRV